MGGKKTKKDNRLDHVTLAFGTYNLCSDRLMEPLVGEMHRQMEKLAPAVALAVPDSFYFLAAYSPTHEPEPR